MRWTGGEEVGVYGIALLALGFSVFLTVVAGDVLQPLCLDERNQHGSRSLVLDVLLVIAPAKMRCLLQNGHTCTSNQAWKEERAVRVLLGPRRGKKVWALTTSEGEE
mmetsp:Transcript_7283/g.18669  ORF Transcript_7283/g.18669 Transcript_7283/m.18669 type:complete len:107 (-) Transcript_7283:238-558(-)